MQPVRAQRFCCPACGFSSDEPILIPDSPNTPACPSCGLTADEGQRKLNDDLSQLFHRGMHLSGDNSASMPVSPVMSSAAVTALGHGSSASGTGWAGSGGGGSGTIDGSPVMSRLGYNISQHYHHSAHINAARPRPVSSHAALGGSQNAASANDQENSHMALDNGMPTDPRSQEPPIAEPYMKSGYEYLAERDYHQQAQNEARASGQYVPALDPAFTSREWWRDFSQPIEFQYGMFQQMNERAAAENEAQHNEDEQMVL